MKKFIAVAGTMGAGKSSMVEFLCSHYPLTPYYEQYGTNPYLKDFYQDMKTWAFKSQVYFLTQKFKSHLALADVTSSVVQDRTIYEDAEIFARNLYRSRLLKKKDFDTYYDLYSSLLETLAPPDLLVYLTCPYRTIRKRIKLRGRPFEQQVKPRYLKRLMQLYDEWIADYNLSEVVVINTDELDYVHNLVDMLDVRQVIEKYI
ncbi:MAG: deoxynucleoside kinase [Deltaproteobacteria bacterium]|nr:deoxynucleoside kinase [Candidatus Anaeroferrophillus wilburensis]MBN2888297.1 deoxynucleoside kinase [Deltaproteobacteria bacterium]